MTIDTTSGTKVTRSATSSVGALKSGETITAIGTAGSGGDISATTISEGTALRGGFGRGAGAGAGAGAK
ncbi:hypothetical protein GCM10025867_40820 [Frondihabitans sucicola]|uniref:DUF5666 domain-containing protein n=1 Tax=Frondihabitans sucicola TaxID=1268041 RepID=A0ABN6Y765_9MICO|nr:hypothetical protein [Frondihabitans sucicola]BDZ51841.1 hypothetical protein GCM10025867_40820 [Frondihabitans sucicola]